MTVELPSREAEEVLRPGQVATLRRRIEALAPERDRLATRLADTTGEAKTLADSGSPQADVDRVLKRATRLRLELGAMNGEIKTLEELVAARLARSPAVEA